MNLQYVTDNLGQKNAVLLSMIDWKKIQKERKELSKYRKLDIALNKLQQLLDLASEEDKEKLRTELSKMVPENENASVHPKISWGHHDDLIQTATTFKVVPCYSTDKKIRLFDLYANLLKNSNFDTTDKFIQGFDVILSENPKQIKMGVLPATQIAEKTTACRISFKIKTNKKSEAKKEKGYCAKCNKYTYLETHYILPKIYGVSGETAELCPNCHEKYHIALDKEINK